MTSFMRSERSSFIRFITSGWESEACSLRYALTLMGSPICTSTVERNLKKLPYSRPTGTMYRGRRPSMSSSASSAILKMPLDSGSSECFA